MNLRTNHKAGDTEHRLLDAAVHLFSSHGFSGTTTREIARLAQVNETSLFRHFPRKEELFWAVLESRLASLKFRQEDLRQAMTQRRDPEYVVPLIVRTLVDVAVQEPQLVRLLCVGLVELRPGTELLYNRHLAPVFHSINDYLQHCVRTGTIRELEPSIASVAFASTILSQMGLFASLGSNGTPFANTELAVVAYSKFWLNALSPISPSVGIQAPTAARAGQGL
jgi:AcrR family transcriptional regulator